MGRNSGGVNKQGSSGPAATKGRTESGYSKKMVANIVGTEQRFRRNADETLHVFTNKGDIVKSIGGHGARVDLAGQKIPQDSILTHNHPRSIGSSGIRSIGNSFSQADIMTAVRTNAAEIRAVTPTYTFSVKRPKNGWGDSYAEVGVSFKEAEMKVRSKLNDYISKHHWSQSSIDVAETMHFHLVMKELSKKYGWEYSSKKG